jgi:hypothetical protein
VDLPKLQCTFPVRKKSAFVGLGFDHRNNLVNVGPDAAGRPQLIQRDDE